MRHVILYAEKKTLLRRLAYRLEGRRSWGARQIDRCLRAFDRDIPGVKLHTDRLSVEQAAERAAALAGLPPQAAGPRGGADQAYQVTGVWR